MAIPTRKLTIISANDTNQKLFFKFFSRLTFILFLFTLFELNAQVIIKEKVEINPQRTIQPENGIGGDNRNPVYLRYGGDVTVRQNAAVSSNYELWEETLGKVAEVGFNGRITEVGTFPQWQKLIFYLLNPSTNQRYYPLITSSSIVGVDYESGWLEFHPSYVPGDPLPWYADFIWTVFIDANYSLAAMPPPEILNQEDVTNPFLPAGELIVPLPGNLYAIVTKAVTQNDALWIDKPATQLIMDELGSHIDDTLFFGQMNVGDTVRFFLRSPNSIVSGMNLYPKISTIEQMMPNGEILMCSLDFEDWTDLLFDDVSIEIYLQPDSGAYAGPIAIFFEPEQIGPNDTTTITFKHRHLDGTLEDIDPLRTFEVGLIDGCTLGILKTETDSGVYINYAYQPMYFIADSSADSGTVMVRAGLIDEGGGASKMISGNLEQDATAETNTAKRYDVLINKNQTTTNKINNNYEVLGDNPGSEFCQLEYYTQDFGVGILGVGDGNWCDDLDECDDPFVFPEIDWDDHRNGFEVTDRKTGGKKLVNVCEQGFLSGIAFIGSDFVESVEYDEVELCFNRETNKIQFKYGSDNEITINYVWDFCSSYINSAGINRASSIHNIPGSLKPYCYEILHSLKLQKIYPSPLRRGDYMFEDIWEMHEDEHRKLLESSLTKFKPDFLIQMKNIEKTCKEFPNEIDAKKFYSEKANDLITKFYNAAIDGENQQSIGFKDSKFPIKDPTPWRNLEDKVHEPVKGYIDDLIKLVKPSEIGCR